MSIKSVHEASKDLDITDKDDWYSEKYIVGLLAIHSFSDAFQFDRELYKVLKIIQLKSIKHWLSSCSLSPHFHPFALRKKLSVTIVW